MSKRQKFEYIIIGSDNHWYASCLSSFSEAMKLKTFTKIKLQKIMDTAEEIVNKLRDKKI